MQAFPILAYMPSLPELLVVLVVVLILFGPKKLPGLSRSIGKSIGEFKRGREEAEMELRNLQKEEASETASEQAKTEESP